MIYFIVLILSLSFIIIDKFIIIKMYGWIEEILLTICVMIILFSITKFYRRLKLSKLFKTFFLIISILFIMWFTMVGIDYKRYKNLYDPLFSVGYEVKTYYDMDIQTGNIYKSKSKFYLLGIKISDINIIEDR